MKNLMVQRQTFRGLFARLAAIVLLAALLTAAPFHTALAVTAPSLGTAQSFAVLGGSTVTNTGPTVITGDLGVSPGSTITGFPPGLVIGGTIHAADAVALGAQGANTAAYLNLAGQACNFDLTGQDLGGMTLVAGVYCFSTSAQLTGALTLDAQGDPNAVWVFQIGSTLTTASNSSVLLINGGQPCNVFWQIGSSATLGTTTSFIGNILALTSITLTTNANVTGRALAQNGAVTMDSNTVAISVCGVPPVTPIPPTLGKAFSPATIAAGGVSTLTITLSNADAAAASLTAPFIDTLPSGVVIAATPNAGTTCGGILTANTGTSTVTLTGGSIPAHGSCTVKVDVTAPSGGSYLNSLDIGVLQTSNGSNAAPAVATLTVPPPSAITLGKAFGPATIEATDFTTMTITLCNTGSSIAYLTAPLTDILPIGLVVAGTGPQAHNTCGGTFNPETGDTTVTLTGGSIPANSCCTVQVDIYAALEGSYFNALVAGALQTSNGNNAAPAVATLTVIPESSQNCASSAPKLKKSFSPATITAGGASTLTITLKNPKKSKVASLTAPLIDTLPSGVVIAAIPNAGTTCGGSLTANAGDTTVTLTGGSIPANGSCTVTVDVTAALVGSYVNSLPAGALQTSNGNNAAAAVATLTVKKPIAPKLIKSFSPAIITAGGDSTLTITLKNSNSTDANLTAPLTDTLPSGVVIAAIPNAGTTCGGSLTANAGDSTVTLTGGLIPANGSCTVTVDVYAALVGSYVNSLPAGALQTSNGNNVAPAVATLKTK